MPGSFRECNVKVIKETSFGCPDDKWCGRYEAENIFTLGKDQNERAEGGVNFWATAKEVEWDEDDQGFVLDLGCKKNAIGVRLKNIGDNGHDFNKNFATKKFR